VELGGSKGRTEATGMGGMFVLMEAVKAMKLKPRKKGEKKLTVAVQGFGNVGYYVSELLAQKGFKVVAVSDSKGGIYCEKGLNPSEVLAVKKEKGSLDKCCKSCQIVSNAQLLELPVDILVPAALENQLTADNAAKVKAQVVLEMANGPTTPEADAVLYKRNIPVIPDVLANAGGVTVSYFEWTQDLSGYFWQKDEVIDKLDKVMSRAFSEVWKISRENKTNLRTGAYVLAVQRILQAVEYKG